MKLLKYSGFPCEHCGRLRVEIWQSTDSHIHLICEKCNWEQGTNGYFDWDSEEEEESWVIF